MKSSTMWITILTSLMTEMLLTSTSTLTGERRKDWPPNRGLPTDPAPRTTLRTTPRTTLNNQTNYFYGEEKHKKPTCSHVHDHNWKQPLFSFHRLYRPSLFHFRLILHRPPARETLKINNGGDISEQNESLGKLYLFAKIVFCFSNAIIAVCHARECHKNVVTLI